MERRSNGSPTITDYGLDNDSKLTNYVGNLEATAPAGFINPDKLKDLAEKIDLTPSLIQLPEGITIEDFEKMNWLSALTECATSAYANAFAESADKYDALWLGNFTRNIWEPDEMAHHAPFEKILLQLGVPQDLITNEVKRVQSLDYIHESGFTPAHLTAFGMVQEFLTRNWYTDSRKILKTASPEAAQMVHMVEIREALHTRWYRDMTAMQIEENPELIQNVAESIKRFQMPGNLLVPQLQEKASKWLQSLHNNDLTGLKRDIVKLVQAAIGGSTNNLGRLMVEIGAQSDSWIERVTMEQAKKGLDSFGDGNGYGILGEGVLQAAGIGNLYEKPKHTDIPGTLRYHFRNYVSKRANNAFDNQFGFA